MRAISQCPAAGLAFTAAGHDQRASIQPGDDHDNTHTGDGGCVPNELRNAAVPGAVAVVGICASASDLTGKNAGIPTTPHQPDSIRTRATHGRTALAHHVGRPRRHRLHGGLRTAMWVMGVAWCAGAVAGMPATSDTTAGNIRSAAEQAVREHFGMPGDRIEVAALALNPRLRLSACDAPLHASVAQFANPASLVTALVQCPQPGSWSLRVPVKMQLFRGVLVSTHALLRGDGLRATDVRVEQRDVTRLGYGYIDNIDHLAGRTLSRALPANSVLTPEALGGRRMVRAGDHVEMIARLDGIEVRANGIALGSGDSGARLRVRNTDSGKVVDGIVQAPGQVIALP